MRCGVPGQHDLLTWPPASPYFLAVGAVSGSHSGSCMVRSHQWVCPGLEVWPPVVAERGAPLELDVRASFPVV